MIIGFGYKARVGKDTCGNYLQNVFSYYKDSFAYSLKTGIGREVFGLSDEQMNTDMKEEVDPFWGLSPRRILQLAGTEGGREIFGTDLWVKTVKRRIDNTPNVNYAICDVRYRNEAEVIKSWGGIVVRVDRDIVGTKSAHISEIDLDNWNGWDYVVDNNQDYAHLYEQLDRIISKGK